MATPVARGETCGARLRCRDVRRVAAAVFLALLLPTTAHAATAFGPVEVVGTKLVTGASVASVNAGGAAAVTGSTYVAADGVDNNAVVVATRAAGGSWREQVVASRLPLIRDPQVVVTPVGTVVAAWSEVTRSDAERIVVATGRAGGTLRVVSEIAVGRAASAFPRLAVLTTGRVLLAYRDDLRRIGSRVPVLAPGAGTPQTLAHGVSALAFGAAGDLGVVVWLDRTVYGADKRRVLRAVRVGARGFAAERSYIVSRDAGSTPRVAGGADGRAIASWLRPGRWDSRGQVLRAPAAFTRSLWPVLRQAQPLVPPDGGIPTGAADVDLAGDATAAAALRIIGGPGGFGVVGAVSHSGGVWTRRMSMAAGSAMNGSVTAVALGARRSLTVWAMARLQLGPATYDVWLAERDANGTIVGDQVLNVPYTHGDGRGVAVAHAGTRDLIAYAAPQGGFAIAERDG